MTLKNIISWALRITIVVIFLQTLYFKFTGHPDSVYIFSKLGVEPYGRIGLGIVEFIASLLILFPKTKIIGFLLSLGIICGAIFSHFLVIGFEIKGDDGTLFILAWIVFIACICLFYIHRSEALGFVNTTLRR